MTRSLQQRPTRDTRFRSFSIKLSLFSVHLIFYKLFESWKTHRASTDLYESVTAQKAAIQVKSKDPFSSPTISSCYQKNQDFIRKNPPKNIKLGFEFIIQVHHALSSCDICEGCLQFGSTVSIKLYDHPFPLKDLYYS